MFDIPKDIVVVTDRGSKVSVKDDCIIVERPESHPSGSSLSKRKINNDCLIGVCVNLTFDVSQYAVTLVYNGVGISLGRYSDPEPAFMLCAVIMKRYMYVRNE